MKTYSPVSIGEIWVDGNENKWYILEYIIYGAFAGLCLSKCISGDSLGEFSYFDKHGKRNQNPINFSNRKNLISKVVDNPEVLL